ncbi:MAG: hypothetical protein EHM87_14350 [Burkholderiales bacterium]|nr:MAG: hypothetical protein EHM87_14350 [Burkholderiales bacterium]
MTIREADNGYIVELREERAFPPGRGAAGKRVFPDYETLSAWLAVHFSKAEKVGATDWGLDRDRNVSVENCRFQAGGVGVSANTLPEPR